MGAHWPSEGRVEGKWIRQLRIPRTASRHIYAVIEHNLGKKPIDVPTQWPWSSNPDFWHTFGSVVLNGSESFHQKLGLWDQRVEGIRHVVPDFSYHKTFAVIRRPIDRFRSSMNQFLAITNGRVPFPIDSYEAFEVVMEKWHFMDIYFYGISELGIPASYVGLRGASNNWWADQRDYLDPSVNVWRFEDGFDEEFQYWLNDIFERELSYDLPPEEIPPKLDYDNMKEEALELFEQVRPYAEEYLQEETKSLGYK